MFPRRLVRPFRNGARTITSCITIRQILIDARKGKRTFSHLVTVHNARVSISYHRTRFRRFPDAGTSRHSGETLPLTLRALSKTFLSSILHAGTNRISATASSKGDFFSSQSSLGTACSRPDEKLMDMHEGLIRRVPCYNVARHEQYF